MRGAIGRINESMVTIREVAKAANVSTGTVSRAFNGYPDISEETKTKIFDIANELGYAPNVNARSLSSKVSNNIGFIVSGFLESDRRDGFVIQMLKGIYGYATKHSVEVALYTLEAEQQKTKTYEMFCAEHSIFGAILSGVATNDPYFTELVKSGMPCVLIDVYIRGEGLGCITIDNVQAASDVAQYLIDRNHRDIVVVQGKKTAEVNNFRIAGIYSTFSKNGLELSRDQILTCDFSETKSYCEVTAYLKKYKKTKNTAFLCLSDIMALGTMRAIKDQGYSIPEDFSVIGFDNIPIAEYTTPALTSVDQDRKEMGYQAAKLLNEMRKNPMKTSCVYVPYKLVERDSVRTLEK